MNTSIAGYYLVERISQSAQGEVFFALKQDNRRPFVIKTAVTANREALRNEALILKNINHDSVARYAGFFETGPLPILVLDYIEGIRLDQLLDGRPGSWQQALYIGLRLTEALSYLQRPIFFDGKYIVHGDLSPANIIVTPSGELKIVDFGCAQALSPSTKADFQNKFATLRYASPNRVLMGNMTLHCDFFAVGIILWEICTGAAYWENLSDDEIHRSLANFSAKDPRSLAQEVPAEFSRIIRACLNQEYFAGYTEAAEILNDLLQLQKTLGLQVGPLDLQVCLEKDFSLVIAERQRKIQSLSEIAFATQKRPDFWERALAFFKPKT